MVGVSSDDFFEGGCRVEEGVEAKLVNRRTRIDEGDVDLRGTCVFAPYLLANADHS